MEKPGIEALLKHNLNIDREVLRRYLEEQSKIAPIPHRRGNTSPYSGRRLTPTGKTGWVTARRALRSYYAAI
jgi:hypothetical protein